MAARSKLDGAEACFGSGEIELPRLRGKPQRVSSSFAVSIKELFVTSTASSSAPKTRHAKVFSEAQKY